MKIISRLGILICILLLIFPTHTNAFNNNWVEKDGKKYYYENGKPVRGFKEIDKNYTFSAVVMIHI